MQLRNGGGFGLHIGRIDGQSLVAGRAADIGRAVRPRVEFGMRLFFARSFDVGEQGFR